MSVSSTQIPRNALALVAILFASFYSFAQDAVFIVPTQFEWQSKENQYRISTIIKTKLVDNGYTVYYNNETLPDQVANNACNNFTIKAIRIKGTFVSKIKLEVTDCQNRIVMQSEIGSSKEKEYEIAYREALDAALKSLMPKLKSVSRNTTPVTKDNLVIGTTTTDTPQTAEATKTVKQLTGQKTARGYAVTTENGVLIQLQKTSQTNIFLAFLDTQPAIAFYNNGKLLLEYYEGNKKIAVNYEVKLPE